MRLFWYPFLIWVTYIIGTVKHTTSFEPYPVWMKIFLIVVLWGITVFAEIINYNLKSDNKKSDNDNTIQLAVLSIETAADFVKEYKKILECNQITMWQYGDVGEGFIIEFYGYNVYDKLWLEELLDDIYGRWKICENDDTLHIRESSPYHYTGSWNKFNKSVWEEVQRKHPDWIIEKVYSHKYILRV